MKILIIDDFATMRKILTSSLKKLGYNYLFEAESTKEGWALLQKEQFDLIISDYNSPDMNGLELLTKIRQSEQFKKQKFIMLTAESDKSLLIDSKKLHIDGYILKPFKIELLAAKINSLFIDE